MVVRLECFFIFKILDSKLDSTLESIRLEITSINTLKNFRQKALNNTVDAGGGAERPSLRKPAVNRLNLPKFLFLTFPNYLERR